MAEFTVNEKFAEKYDHEKARDEVVWRKQQGLDESDGDSSTDDEDGACLTKGLDRQISETLRLIRSKDPKIYDPDTKLYNSDEEETSSSDDSGSDDSDSDSDDDAEEAAAAAPLTIKDQLRQKVMAKLDADESASDSGSEDDAPAPSGRSYVQEQAALKASTRAAVKADNNEGSDDDDDDDDLFSVKVHTQEEDDKLAEIFADSYSKEQESDAARAKKGEEMLARGQKRISGDPPRVPLQIA
jgi:protein KRI1